MIAALSLASCGAGDRAANRTEGGATVENATLTRITLASDAFDDGGPIPAQYGCEGIGETPALRWSDPPAGTTSFALVVVAPDASSRSLSMPRRSSKRMSAS